MTRDKKSRKLKDDKKLKEDKKLPKVEKDEAETKSEKSTRRHPKPEDRGIVFIARLPPSFQEGEMKKYFSQFGVVTRIRRKRSRKTGNVTSWGWVEFASRDVAKVVATHVNGYILGGQRLFAECVPQTEANMTIMKYHRLRKGTKADNYNKYKEATDNPLVGSITKEARELSSQKLEKQIQKLQAQFDINWPIRPL